jgi:hypothetical protein
MPVFFGFFQKIAKCNFYYKMKLHFDWGRMGLLFSLVFGVFMGCFLVFRVIEEKNTKLHFLRPKN